MKSNTLTLAVGIATALNSSFIYAQSSFNDLEKITVLSSGIEVPYRELATSVTLLDSEDLERSGQLSMIDVLRDQVGISASRNGGVGQTSTIRLRGEEGARSKVYIDGIELADPAAPQTLPLFSNLLSNHIQRVEILRGPQSLAYGADAGGIISLHTGSNPDQLGSLNLEAGRYGSRMLALNAGTELEEGDVFVSAHKFETDGINARTNDLTGEEDGYSNSTVHSKASYDLTEEFKIGGVLRYADAEVEFDQCYDPATFAQTNDCQTDTTTKAGRLYLEYATEKQQHRLGYSLTDTSRKTTSNKVFSNEFEGKIALLDYRGAYHSELNTIAYGLELKTEKSNSTYLPAELSRDQKSAYFEYHTSPLSDLFLNLAVRYDDNDTFGSNTSYRLGSAYLIAVADSSLKFKASYGTGFRAPSLYEQDYNNGSAASGEAAGLQLKQEESEGLDFGIEWFAKDTQASLVYFKQEIDNAIYFDLASYQGYLQETGISESSGVEFAVEHAFSQGFSVSANYTYNDAKTAQGSKRILRPENQFAITAALMLSEQLSVNANLRWVDEQQDSSGATIDSFHIVNLNINYLLDQHSKLSLKVNNLFDKAYTEVVGYNTQGSSVNLGYQYSF